MQLNRLTTKPRINDISLELLREYYETFLHPFEFHYTVNDSLDQDNIKLRFDKENFPIY